eukprot:Blabericola_migrator_1__12810@NODE_825_length_6370_cov_320_094241_g582_i0_p2_GENE_NODE_825_length_6370_cov_320_094241_g582_i0NODE_825_length_6370_cov_320_094241_g582_i0_p2_ORF_typecomplete_len398_score49_70CRTlike/PF08627_10/1_8e20CRTlike/PF08627_10/1e03SLC35F/PF06027_12/2_4e19Nuc_sug_transp/PF04142_15/4e19UAA/PF08449_11/1_1e16PUNUT/PF16913_5/1_2e14TPT/PF03151_16/3e13EamA/PF00892_20/3_1e06EamA/PF00892_20/1_4e02EamA/PF00892_20/9_5e03DUF2101/PF09874_9/0_5DUF2101/PF09874_9/2_1e02_NODE_825_length_63
MEAENNDIYTLVAPEEESTPSCPVPWYGVWIAAALTFTSGVFCTFAFKIQDRTRVPRCQNQSNPDCKPVPFAGANFQTMSMFMAEALCWFPWCLDRWLMKGEDKPSFFDFNDGRPDTKPEAEWWYWILPAFCDFLATLCYATALLYIYASTQQMMINFYIVVAAVMQLVLVRRALRVHEYISVSVITLSLVLTAIPAIQLPDTSSNTNTELAWVGIALCIAGTAATGFQSMYEDFVFTNYTYGVLKAVWVEGLVGLVLTSMSTIVLHHTGLEDASKVVYQVGHSARIQATFGLYLIAGLLFNGAGMCVTMLGSGLLRLVCNASRTPAVWIIDVSVNWIEYNSYNLIATLIFVVGFIVHVRMWPSSKMKKLHLILSQPVHFCCSKRELDEDLSYLTDT